jgi:hypothetical protein
MQPCALASHRSELSENRLRAAVALQSGRCFSRSCAIALMFSRRKIMLLIIILIVLNFGFGYGGYRVGPGWGYYGGGGLSLLLTIVLVLLLLKVI